ncbi:divergent PAP2 family protein [Candidatus Woesearchaeota archaeon]|nr:divergent PAP2 family protein [Candidatus Woesearchaeota archaeon]
MLLEFITNKIMISCLAAMLVSGILKILFKLKKTGKFDIYQFWQTGGMPSSHSAFVSALTVSVFFIDGIDTILYVTIVFALIVIWDAFGVRQEAGKQATIINRIVADLKLEKKLNIFKLKELVGHTTTQVQVGILIGASIAVLVHFFV